jgi:cyanophycinase
VVRARPDRLGLGIDEGCGVTISPKGMLTVVGPGVVFVIDGSKAQSSGADVPKPGAALSVTGLQLHVLSDGDEFDLKARQIVRR